MMLPLFFALVSIVLSAPPIVLNETVDLQTFLKTLPGIGPVLVDLPDNNTTHKKKHLFGEDPMRDYAAELFATFKDKYNKKYSTEEEHVRRYHIFQENMLIVEYHQRSERGSAKYSALTPFGDMTEAEFKKYYKMPTKFFEQAPILPQAHIPPMEDTPASFDWREKGAVTKVKNQGQCGSCWAFSTTGNIEGQWFLSKDSLVSLSEQELVDCDKTDQGCEGGLPSNAYKQIMKLGGLEGEKDYPYSAEDGSCHFKKAESKVYINSSLAISQDEKAMAAWLAKNGPISIGINANMMQFYTGGVSHPWQIFCGHTKLDHGVLIVGYGTDGSTPYWIVKNSWGETWGEKGYYRVYRGDGTCGVNQMCTSAVVH